LKVAQKRPLIAFMQDSFQVSERRACGVLRLIRSSCRRKSTRKDPVVLRQRIRDLAESRVLYGYRRIHILLQREGFKVGKDRVHRLYRQEGLSLRRKRPRRHVSAARRVERPKPQQKNQSWSMDFVSNALFNGRRFRAFTLVENALRFVRPRRSSDPMSPSSWMKLSRRTAGQNESIWTTVPSSSRRRWTFEPTKPA
jgi:putative transposase